MASCIHPPPPISGHLTNLELLRQWTLSLRIHLSDWIFIRCFRFSPNKTTPSLLNSEWSSTLRRSRCSELGFMKRSRVLFRESSAGKGGMVILFLFPNMCGAGFLFKRGGLFLFKAPDDFWCKCSHVCSSPPVPLTNFELFSASSQVVELFKIVFFFFFWILLLLKKAQLRLCFYILDFSTQETSPPPPNIM